MFNTSLTVGRSGRQGKCLLLGQWLHVDKAATFALGQCELRPNDEMAQAGFVVEGAVGG